MDIPCWILDIEFLGAIVSRGLKCPMQTFHYRGYDRAGHACKGLVEAINAKDARKRLAAAGTLAEDISMASQRTRFCVADRLVFYRELGSLLAAGLPLVKALDTLIQTPETEQSRALLAGVRDAVREGASLSDALSSAADSVGAFEQSVLKAAERSGDLEGMLERLSTFLEERERLQQRIVSALIYPGIVFAVGVCVAVIMLGFLVPRAQDILMKADVPLPAITRLTVGLGAAAARIGVPLLVLAALGVLAFRRRMRRDEDLRTKWDRLLYRIPLFGRGYGILVNLRFAQTLAVLTRGGVPLVDGLVLAGKASGSQWVARLAERGGEAVRHGSSLSDAVRGIPPLAETLPGWIQIGEAGGGIERLLETAGRRYRERWDRFIGRGLSLLEPVLILVIGAFVLLVTLSIVLPVISLSQGITG